MNTEHRAQGFAWIWQVRQEVGYWQPLPAACLQDSTLLLFTELSCNNDKNDTNNSNTVDHLFLSDQDFL